MDSCAKIDEKEKVMKQIAEFFLEKNDNNLKNTEEEINSMGISDVIVEQATLPPITLSTSSPGRLIGKRGQNIEKMETYLGRKIKIKEVKSILDYLPSDEIVPTLEDLE